MNDKARLSGMLEQCGAIKFGEFTLTSGAKSNYYVDIKKASTNPQVLKNITQQLITYTDDHELLAGVELGAVPIVVAVSLKTDIPYVIIRKGKRKHGTSKQIEGPRVEGKKVLLLEDVTTSGGSAERAIQILRDEGAQIDEVVTVVDRESGAEKRLQDMQVTLHALLRASEFVKND